MELYYRPHSSIKQHIWNDTNALLLAEKNNQLEYIWEKLLSKHHSEHNNETNAFANKSKSAVSWLVSL